MFDLFYGVTVGSMLDVFNLPPWVCFFFLKKKKIKEASLLLLLNVFPVMHSQNTLEYCVA